MQSKTTVLASCLWLATLALGGCFGGDAAPTPTPRPFALAPLPQEGLSTTYQVARGDVVAALNFAGNVDLADEEEVYFATNGWLVELPVDHGVTVQAGQLLGALDARAQQYDRDDAKLSLAQAESRLAKQEKERAASLFRAEQTLAREQLRLAQLQDLRNSDPTALAVQEIAVRLAEFELAQIRDTSLTDVTIERDRARLRLQRTETALTDAQATAPISGQLLLLEAAEVGNQFAAYEPFAVVIDPASVLVTASLPPASMRAMREGMPVTLRLEETGAGPSVAATVQALPAPYGSGRSLVEIIASDPADNELLQPGASVQVSAELERAENVLWLPPAALQGYKDAYFVRLTDGSEAPVTVGLQNDERVEILSGLTEGQVVLGR